MPAPIAAAAALAARFAARKLANDAAKKSVKKAVARKSATVRVKPKTTASGPGLETRGNKITAESQKVAAKKLIQEDRNRTINSPSMNYIDSTFRGPSLKTINKNKPVKRAAEKKLPIKINTDPTKPKGVFGPLKKKVEAANTPANRAKAKANARGLKAAQGKSLAPKKYKPDTEGRKQVKRFAAPLEKANGKKTSMRMGAQAVDAGRSSMKIKAAPKNRSK